MEALTPCPCTPSIVQFTGMAPADVAFPEMIYAGSNTRVLKQVSAQFTHQHLWVYSSAGKKLLNFEMAQPRSPAAVSELFFWQTH